MLGSSENMTEHCSKLWDVGCLISADLYIYFIYILLYCVKELGGLFTPHVNCIILCNASLSCASTAWPFSDLYFWRLFQMLLPLPWIHLKPQLICFELWNLFYKEDLSCPSGVVMFGPFTCDGALGLAWICWDNLKVQTCGGSWLMLRSMLSSFFIF